MSGHGEPLGARTAAGSTPGCDRRPGVMLRRPVFVVVSLALGLGAHVLVDRALPHPRLLVLGALAVTACAVAVRRRETSFAALTVTLLVGQAVLHGVLGLGHCTPGSAFGTFVHRALCPDAMTPTQARWAADPLLVAPPTAAGPGGYLLHLYPGHTMLLAHLAAALVACWCLRRGEAAAWAAARSVRPGVRLLLDAAFPVTVGVRVRAGSADPVVTLHDRLASRRAHPRRGPPLPA